MRFECQCGHTIHDISDGHYYKAYLIPDKKWVPFWDAIDVAIEKSGPTPKDKEKACMELRKKQYSRPIYQCPSCARIYITDINNELVVFKPELENTPNTLFDTESS